MNAENYSFLNQCQKNLIDTSARNNLINFRFSAVTCFDIDKFSQIRKKQKNQERSFEIEKLGIQRDDDDLNEMEKLQREAHKALGKIYLKQQEIKDEKGFNPTSWAYCFFNYKDGDKERSAPIFLISTEVSKNGKGGYCVDHFSNGALEVSFNHAIYEKLKNDFKINLDKALTSFSDSADILISDVDQKISEIIDFLAGNIHGILVEKKVVIGIFNSAKASLYNELVELEDEFLKHDLIKIFLSNQGDELDQGELSEDAREIDKIVSDKFFSPFDFDSSQLQAIKAAKDGKNFVIQGPPGTGKTQTISNIIAELVAQGKKVLFVAEKKAAIDAVLKNFSKIGLEKIFLDLHDKKSKSKDIVSQVIDSIEFFQNENFANRSGDSLLSKLDQVKKELSQRSELLHKKLNFGKKPFDLIFELSEMDNVRKVDGNFFTQLSEEDFDKCLHALDQIKDLSNIYLDPKNPFLNTDLIGLKNFLENDKEQKSLPRLKSLILDTRSKNSKLREIENKVADSFESTTRFGFNIKKFERDDELRSTLELFQEALPYKDLLESESNPWLKMPIKNPELFDAKEAREVLERLQKLLNIKTTKEEELKLLRSDLSDLEDSLKKLTFVEEDNSSLKNAINLFGKLKEHQNLIYGCNQDWLHVGFKNQCFENDNFLKDLICKFELLIENIKILSELESELNRLRDGGFSLNFYQLLKGFVRKGRIISQASKIKFNISSLKDWIENHVDLGDKSRMFKDVSLIEIERDFVVQNGNILIFKDLQNKIYEAGFKDFFLDTIVKKNLVLSTKFGF